MHRAEGWSARYHAGTRGRRPYAANPCDVARLAKSFAAKLYPDDAHDDDDVDDDDDRRAVAYRAGLLVYGCELYGLTYEQIAGCVGPQAAHVVRELSQDNRLLPAEREQRQREAIAACGSMPQLVKLAEILASTREALRLPDDSLTAHRLDLRRWHAHQAHIVRQGLPELSRQPAVAEPLRAAAALLDKLGHRLLRVLGRVPAA